jgi:hypothetical protein
MALRAPSLHGAAMLAIAAADNEPGGKRLIWERAGREFIQRRIPQHHVHNTADV